MALTREQIRDGWVQQLVADADHPVRALSEDELRQSRAAILAGHIRRRGSGRFRLRLADLEPGFHFARREVAHDPRPSSPVLPVDQPRPRHGRRSRA